MTRRGLLRVPAPRQRTGTGRRRLLPRSGTTVIGAVLLAGIAVLAAVVPLLPGYDPYEQDIGRGLWGLWSGQGGELFPLGTDTLGRDLLSRLALASQVSILIGVSAVLVSLVVGVLLGLIAGYFRGPAENLIMGLADLQLSIPRVLLLIAVVAVVGPSVVNLTLLLAATSWVAYGRVARAMALSLREREFVLSAVTQGASATWSIRKHLLPNVSQQMIIVGSYELGQIIVLEASMSYLGLGVQPPLPSLGRMISQGQDYLQSNPWLSVLPGIAIFMLVGGLQFMSQRFTAERHQHLDLTSKTST